MTPTRAPRRDFWLTLGENLRIAVRALRANKMRTILTIIGNVVAVMSVIAVVSIIDGMNTYVSEKILDQGLRVIYIDKYGLITDEDEWRLAQRRRDLTTFESGALEDRMRQARRVVGQVETNKTVRYRGTELKNVRILGTTEGYSDVGKYEMAEGRALETNDFERRRPVTVIGSELAEKLFPYVDPIGESIRVSGYDLRVVGILASRGNVLGQSQDNIAIVPMGQFSKMYGSRGSLTILVAGQPDVSLDRLEDEARVVLRSVRHVPLGQPDDFAISTAETYMALYQTLTSGIFAGTIGLVAISLVVGGIVIMNIMLVAVTERTREIGIRKAVGARRADLISQFLSESVVLALLGGVVGVLAGVAIALLIRAVTPLPATIQPWSVAISLGVASAVGLFFGVYPATRAAKLDPIVALRQE